MFRGLVGNPKTHPIPTAVKGMNAGNASKPGLIPSIPAGSDGQVIGATGKPRPVIGANEIIQIQVFT